MRRLLVIVLFAVSVFGAQSFLSTPQAQAAWTNLRANPPNNIFPTALAACHNLDALTGGRFVALLPGGGFPIFGVTVEDTCVHDFPNTPIGPDFEPVWPVCGSGDIGPNQDGAVPGGCSSATSPNPKQLCNCGDSQGNNGDSTVVGNPISVNTGNKFEQVTDYESAGPNKLAFIRTYNSQSRFFGHLNPFTTLGLQWQSNFDRTIFFQDGIQLRRPGGAILRFVQVNGGAWVPLDSDTDMALTADANLVNFTFTGHDDTVETLARDLTTGQVLLQTITYRNGYTQTMQYTAIDSATSTKHLASVTDSYGRTLSFTYANGVLQTLTDPDGRVYTYNYDSVLLPAPQGDRLKSVVYPGSSAPTVQYLYENATYPFALTGISDENGNRFATWAYDANERATSSQHAGGADLTTVAYNADGSATVTNALGVADTYKFTTLQSVPKVTEIDRAATATTAAATRRLNYDSNGYLASETDWNGNLTSYVNDSRGNVTSKTEASGSSVARTSTTTWSTTFHVPTQIVEPGRTTAFTLDSFGRVITKTQTDTTTGTVPYSTTGRTRSWSYTYNATGELATVTGPLGDVTTYAYDSTGALTSVSNALNQATSITAHTASGRPQTVVDPNSVTTTLAYDGRNRLTSTSIATAAGNAVTTIAYDLVGNVTQITRPDGSFVAYTYDNAHRLTTVTDATGATITYTLDALGDRTQTQIAASGGTVTKTQSEVFDALGRLLKNIGAASQTTIYAYDPNGNATSITDPLSNVTGQSFDALNRLIQVAAPLSETTNYAYDARDNRTGVTDPLTNVTSYVYDGLDDLIQQVSPDTGTTVYQTDAAGNRTQQTDAAGNVINFTYDLLSRVTAKTFPGDTAENVAYTYDGSGAGDGVGRLTSVTDQSGSTAYVYDALGNATQETAVLSANGSSVSFTTAYGYDLASHVVQITNPAGPVVNYTRDAMGRIASVATQTSGISTTVASGALYEPFGPLAALTFGNGLSLSAQFDQDYQPSARTVTSATTTVQNLSYNFDAAGNPQTITDDFVSARSQSFQYDAVNHLSKATGAYGNFTYFYLPNGGLWILIGPPPGLLHYLGSTGNQVAMLFDRVPLQTFSYTPTGNITSDTFHDGTVETFTYNQNNRLVGVQQGSTTLATYVQNFLGQRVIKLLNGGATEIAFHYDRAGHLLGEHDGASTSLAYIWLDDLPLAFIDNGTLDYIHTDHLGTPQKMTDGGQNVVWDGGASDPFMMAPLPTNLPMNLRMSGQYFDAETGLHYNGMRDYDPTLGRYIESDPIGLDGGINTYAYVGGNPVRYTDASGLYAVASPSNPMAPSPGQQCAAAVNCNQICAELALPTLDYGTSFYRCVLACKSGGTSGFPEWDRHFR